jgi:hypothetical protein
VTISDERRPNAVIMCSRNNAKYKSDTRHMMLRIPKLANQTQLVCLSILNTVKISSQYVHTVTGYKILKYSLPNLCLFANSGVQR